jgi:YD repeat-containing protein
MKKIFLLLIAASAALTSCGSDDGDGGSKKPSVITMEGGGDLFTYNMTYDDKSRLSTMSSTYNGAHTFTFAYNEKGKVSNVAVSDSGYEGVAFTYDAQGRLATVTRTGHAAMPVTWTDSKTLTVDGSTIKLDAKGDFAYLEGGTFSRDSGKGAFANVKGVDALTMYFTEYETLFFAAKRPVKMIDMTGFSYVMNNAFESGMFSGATYDLQGTAVTMHVTY